MQIHTPGDLSLSFLRASWSDAQHLASDPDRSLYMQIVEARMQHELPDDVTENLMRSHPEAARRTNRRIQAGCATRSAQPTRPRCRIARAIAQYGRTLSAPRRTPSHSGALPR